MPRPHNLAAAPVRFPRPPEKHPDGALVESVSTTSVSFVACGAAVADLGALLHDLRLALRVSEPGPSGPESERAAAQLTVRLDAARSALDDATVAIADLLAEAAPAAAAPRSVSFRGPTEAGHSLPATPPALADRSP